MTQDSTPVGSNKAVGPKGTTRTIPERVVRRVWVAAGGRCTFCNRYLLDEDFTGQPVSVGQLAHIVGWTTAQGSPRGDDPLDVGDRNHESNLMLMCHDQHRVIDNRSMWEVYGTDRLRTFKRTHEHRIKSLTALTDQDRSTVLRVIGTVHGASVTVSNSDVATTLLAAERFPDYALAGLDEFEVDLRQLPSEGASETYWTSGVDHIRESLTRLNGLVAREKVRHLSIFPLARIPLLVALGTMLDDTIPTEIYPKRRDAQEAWGWTPGAPTVEFEYREISPGQEAKRVEVVFSVSGTVDQTRIPADSAALPRYEIAPTGADPGPELIASRASLDNFAKAWRGLLAQFEKSHPGLETIDIFAAVPVTAAVTIGRTPMRAIHPRLHVFDRNTTDGSYIPALEVGR